MTRDDYAHLMQTSESGKWEKATGIVYRKGGMGIVASANIICVCDRDCLGATCQQLAAQPTAF